MSFNPPKDLESRVPNITGNLPPLLDQDPYQIQDYNKTQQHPKNIDRIDLTNLMQKNSPVSLETLINPNRHVNSIIGMFSGDLSPQTTQQNAKTTQQNAKPASEPEKPHENDAWMRHLTHRFNYVHKSGGIMLFADNKIEIRSSPTSLNYIVINPEYIRYIKIVGSKIFLAEKTLYGFSEITYEYHQTSDKNKEDMVMLMRYIVFVKMQESLDKFSAAKSKIFSEDIEEQINAIKYTYPIVCLYSHGFTYEYYLCDSSYEYEGSLLIKIDNDIGCTNMPDNHHTTLRILVRYTIYTLYLTCNDMPKKSIIEIMNKLFNAIRNAKNSKHCTDAIKITKKIKTEDYFRN